MAKGQIPENAYPEEDRKAALELAARIGTSAAAQQLHLPRATIYRWRGMYPQYWSDLMAGDEAVQRQGFSKRLDALADAYTETEFDALARAEDLIKHADAKELAGLIKAMGSSRQAAIGGSRTVLGEPEQHEHHIDFPQIEQAMLALLAQAEPRPALQVENLAEAEDAD